MYLTPVFEIGLWNAWIFILPLIIISIFGARILRSRNSGEYSILTKAEKKLAIIYMVIIFTSYAYSIFLPLKLGTVWFYAGLSIFLPGLVIVILAILSFATTAVDKPVTKGIYRISRNPMLIGELLIYLSIGISCVSWIFLLVVLLTVILRFPSLSAEERFCLQKYGDAYRLYMNKTPKWLGIPRIS